ncbi:hypothetical protein [Pseudomonas sp. VB3]|uniref:hypothetical protein n=1 Tax=Pseudomonas sp. VB3 TaxID=2994641 RepID=UPI0022EC7028|nr:hypothetical protein [Pseudomonas sp. VB3]
MTDQTQRLEIATVKAEIGSNIVYRFSNDAINDDGIPTESGDIQNLKQIIKIIEDKASVSSSIYTTVAEGLVATPEGGMFLVQSDEDDEIYVVWRKVDGAAVDTGKRTLSSQAAENAVNAAQASADASEASALLAQEAANDFQEVIAKAVISVSSMHAFCQLGTYRTGVTYCLAAWHTSAVVAKLRGGGNFVYDPTIAKSKHNGGYIISPTVPITSSVASTPAFLAGTGETDPSGFGCLVRVTTGDIWAEYFGLFDDASYSWNCKSFNAAIKWADVVAPDISPGMVSFMDGEFRTTDPIIIWRPNGQTGRIPGFRGAGAYNSTIIKTTNNTTGAQYAPLNIDAAVIEIPKTGDDLQIGGANSGGFSITKLSADRTGYGYYAARSYFGKRTDMFIKDFNQGFSSPGCWMQHLDMIWTLGCNVGFTLSGTSNHGGNLYAGNSHEIGFDLSGLTYSNLSTACDGTGSQGTIPKIAYKLSGSHGITLTCGVEKAVGTEFSIAGSFGVTINGHSFGTGISTVTTRKLLITGSTVKFNFDWNLSLGNLTSDDKAFYPSLYTKDVNSTLDFGVCNFGDTDPRMPRTLDGRLLSNIGVSPYRNMDGNVTHQLLLSSSTFKKALYVGSSSRIKFVYGVCTDPAVDTSFEPSAPLGHAVSTISTNSASPTDIGNLYIDGVASIGRLSGYMAGGWLYLRGPSGQQRIHSLSFITAPLA